VARAVGVDFGTTNSALAASDDGGRPVLAEFVREDGSSEPVFRSILYFEREEGSSHVLELAGPRAIDRYLGAEEPGRLIQSLKSFLAHRDFSSTSVFGSAYRLEALIAIILRELRVEAEESLGDLPETVVVGRPVRFANQKEPEDAEFALARLRASFHNAGFPDIVFEYEPVAAAYHYEDGLDHDELILIADFGGGTSDFSLLRVGPGVRASGDRAGALLGTDGVPIAGDAFDGRIVRQLVAPLLGMGSQTRSMFDRVLVVPSWIYAHLQRWHHLSFLKSPRTLQILYDLRKEALEPAKLDALIHLVEEDLGFPLHRAVEHTKLDLSTGERADFRFDHPPVRIATEEVARADFEGWIAEEIAAMAGCVDGLLERCGAARGDVDRVFMTGGTSLVPAVHALFAERFGEERIRSGGELTSVASGLALRAAELL
jgi:hypothetical chaperone protein